MTAPWPVPPAYRLSGRVLLCRETPPARRPDACGRLLGETQTSENRFCPCEQREKGSSQRTAKPTPHPNPPECRHLEAEPRPNLTCCLSLGAAEFHGRKKLFLRATRQPKRSIRGDQTANQIVMARRGYRSDLYPASRQSIRWRRGEQIRLRSTCVLHERFPNEILAWSRLLPY